MKVPPDWPLLVLAAGSGSLAVIAGRNLETAVPAGALAVAAAGFLLAGSMGRVAWRRTTSARMDPPTSTSTLRAAFRSGRAGRAAVVAQLDRLERSGPRPDLPARTMAEEERISRLPRPEFRRYVRERLDTIEAWDP